LSTLCTPHDLAEEVDALLGLRQSAEVAVDDNAVEAVIDKHEQTAKQLVEEFHLSSPRRVRLARRPSAAGRSQEDRVMTQRKTRHPLGAQRQTRESLHLAKEVRTIQHRAAEHDGRIVSIGPLVFFSTDTGDAWMLEPADHRAAKLAVGGDPLPVLVEETEDQFAVGWQGRFHFDGDTFVYEDNESGRLGAIRGYPVKQLQRAISAALSLRLPAKAFRISNMSG
jgi:hypothetical protein